MNNSDAHIQTPNIKELFERKISVAFSPGKFVPPLIDPLRYLFRSVALRPLIFPERKNSNLIFINAQAGQGKSTLAAQFIQHIQARSAWIQLDLEDRDPVMFLTALFTALYKDFPVLENSTVYRAIANGEIDGEDPSQLTRTLLKEITPLLEQDYYLVLDDLHLLKESANSLTVLKLLAAQIPPGFNLILLSRIPIEGVGESCLYLDNGDLALSQREVADLYKNIFNMPLSADIVAELHHKTEGWVMGLIMAKHALTDSQAVIPSGSPKFLMECQLDQFQSYFQAEVLVSIPPHQQLTLLALALLENVPLDLAEEITRISNLDELLAKMVQDNFFLRHIDTDPPVYYFHHLLKEFMAMHARKVLSDRQQRIILAKAGHWHLVRGRNEQALRYYLRAQVYYMADKILRDVGLDLMATNRTATLKEIIGTIPHDVVSAYAWLSFIIADVYIRSDPFQSEVYLEQARQKFIEHSDDLGELMATTTLIIFHAGFDCKFKQGMALLPVAEELYRDLRAELSGAARMQSANAIALGLCYFTGQTNRAAEYAFPIFELAEENGMDSAMAEASVSCGLINNLRGNWSTFRQHIEKTLFLLSSARVGSLSKLMMFSQQVALIGLEGDFSVYEYYKNQMFYLIDQNLLAKTISGPLLLIADINNALAQGRISDAMQHSRQGLASEGSGQSHHLQSLYKGYMAYILALLGKKDEALSAAEESAGLRKSAGGVYHEVVNQMILGGVYTVLKLNRSAESLLSKAIVGSEKLGEMFIRVSAYAHRAVLRLSRKNIQPALEDIRFLLETMQANQYHFFHTWNPDLMEKILTTAIVHAIEPDYAQRLANERLMLVITSEGDRIPILEMITLGKFELKLNGVVKGRFNDFSAIQRELLALLVSAPKEGLSLEMIQVVFWPESPPDKVRSKFDNLLGRLRKSLNKILSPHPAADYLYTDKGFLRLTNCRTDAADFMHNVDTGLKHLYSKEYWQSGNSFLRANLRYNGKFMPKVRLREHAANFREMLLQSFLDSTRRWVEILTSIGRIPEAVKVCRKALEHGPTYQPLVETAYHLLTQSDTPFKASEIIDNYKNALTHEGFTPSEIDAIMDHFWS